MDELEKLNRNRKAILYLAGDVNECLKIIEKLDNDHRDEIIQHLTDWYNKLQKEADATLDLILHKKKLLPKTN